METVVRMMDRKFVVMDWEAVSEEVRPGVCDSATWRTREGGGLRVRMVEYTAGYVADHWCDWGLVLLVLEGELVTDLRDGRRYVLKRGMSYQVSDLGDASHRSSSPSGAKLFIVD